MYKDPLNVFLNEKTAAMDVANTVLDDFKVPPEKPFTANPDPSSLDPGERALAGYAAISGSLAAKIIPYAGSKLLADYGTKDVVPWENVLDIEGAKSFRHARSQAPRGRTAKVMGLFNVTGRQRPIEQRAMQMVGHRFEQLEPLVDSFINKHNLAEKGVRMRFPTGIAGEVAGPRYNLSTKEVHLPELSKSVVLHELGHAADYTKGRLAKFRRIAEPLLERGILTALPVALIAGDRIKEMLPGTVDDKAIEFMQNHAPEIMGATLAATQLYPEAKASYLALNHIAKTEGRDAAKASLKRLAPLWGTYLLGVIPAVVGMALARKYMREARSDRDALVKDTVGPEIEKVGGVGKFLGDIVGFAREGGRDVAHVARQINNQSFSLIRQPGTMRKIVDASKAVGSSPDFVHGALISAVPASLAALYLYGTPSGKVIRDISEKEHNEERITDSRKGLPLVSRVNESWRQKHPAQFAGLVGIGAALSGGIMSKFLADLGRVL